MTARSIASASIAQRLWPAEGAAVALRALVLALLGSLLLALSAKVQVPFWPVPMTMQTFVVLMLGAAYGWRLGGATVLLYLAEGAMGMPVFAGSPEKGIGLAYMMGPTGGYLAGFVVAAVATGWLVERGWGRSLLALTAAMLIGHALILGLGVTWLATALGLGWTKAVAVGLTPFWAATALKTALAVAALLGLDRLALRQAR